MNDFIDIGVMDGKGEDAKMLRIEKHRLGSGKQTFQLTVDSKPSRAGIDPYNKLIDRNSEDNPDGCYRAIAQDSSKIRLCFSPFPATKRHEAQNLAASP